MYFSLTTPQEKKTFVKQHWLAIHPFLLSVPGLSTISPLSLFYSRKVTRSSSTAFASAKFEAKPKDNRIAAGLNPKILGHRP